MCIAVPCWFGALELYNGPATVSVSSTLHSCHTLLRLR